MNKNKKNIDISTFLQDDTFLQINKNEVFPNENQTRKHFDESKLKELQVSIEKHGQLQPVLVKKIAGKYEIIAGERRWRAIRNSTIIETIDVVIRHDKTSDLNTLLAQIEENEKRENISVFEYANALSEVVGLYKKESKTQKDACEVLNVSAANLSKYLKIAKSPAFISEISINNETQDFQSLYFLNLAHEIDSRQTQELIEDWRSQQYSFCLRKASNSLIQQLKSHVEKKVVKKPLKKLLPYQVLKFELSKVDNQTLLMFKDQKEKTISLALSKEVLAELQEKIIEI